MLGESRWFTRGWTLQELLAPTHLKFYNLWWGLLGRVDKKGGTILQSISLAEAKSLDKLLVKITRIPEEYIEGSASLNLASVATKMSWASARQTTRTEDIAYYLLSRFDVAIPMLYGEGTKAFVRLQEEIMKNEDDQTIFAWGYGSCSMVGGGATSFFAKSPDDFASCNKLEPFFLASTKPSHYVTTNKGLHIEMALLKLITGEFVGRINCLDATDSNLHCLAIPLLEVGGLEDVYYRPSALALQKCRSSWFRGIDPKPIYINRTVSNFRYWAVGIRLSDDFCKSITVRAVHPPNWDLSQVQSWKRFGPVYPGFKTEGQIILLDCINNQVINFVIRVDHMQCVK